MRIVIAWLVVVRGRLLHCPAIEKRVLPPAAAVRLVRPDEAIDMPLRGLAHTESNAVDRREVRADAPLDAARQADFFRLPAEISADSVPERSYVVRHPRGVSSRNPADRVVHRPRGWIEIASITASEVFVNPVARALPPSSCAAVHDEGLRRTVLRESSVVALVVTGRIRRK